MKKKANPKMQFESHEYYCKPNTNCSEISILYEIHTEY